jgi:D-3-phosphoglycerate dehydrogenase
LQGKTVGVVGYGHIGRALVRKLNALGTAVVVYDPVVSAASVDGATLAQWPEKLGELDFLVLACALTEKNKHMLDADAFGRMRQGIRIINVSRGGLINQAALLHALESGLVVGAALEVLEEEPPRSDEPLLKHPHCIFGSHNSSNTSEAVLRTSMTAIELLFERLSGAR